MLYTTHLYFLVTYYLLQIYCSISEETINDNSPTKLLRRFFSNIVSVDKLHSLFTASHATHKHLFHKFD